MALFGRKEADSRFALQNAAKTLFANIRFAAVDDPIQSIVITSAIPGEGKTSVACELARAIASSGVSVCMVECDMRRHSLAARMNVRAQHGLYAVLSGECELEEAVCATDTPNLYVLDAEPQIPNPADIIASRRFAKLVAQLESTYAYVIFDTPPVGAFVDAAEVGHLADGVVFVVRENYAKRKEVVRAVEQLRKAEVHLVGTVMNCSESASNAYYEEYGRKRKGERQGSTLDQPSDFSTDLTPALPPRRTASESVSDGHVPQHGRED